jgi:hypothetical protein
MFLDLFHKRSSTHISHECLLNIKREESTRGVDLPSWRTPKEVNKIRLAERKKTMHLVRKTGT